MVQKLFLLVVALFPRQFPSQQSTSSDLSLNLTFNQDSPGRLDDWRILELHAPLDFLKPSYNQHANTHRNSSSEVESKLPLWVPSDCSLQGDLRSPSSRIHYLIFVRLQNLLLQVSSGPLTSMLVCLELQILMVVFCRSCLQPTNPRI